MYPCRFTLWCWNLSWPLKLYRRAPCYLLPKRQALRDVNSPETLSPLGLKVGVGRSRRGPRQLKRTVRVERKWLKMQTLLSLAWFWGKSKTKRSGNQILDSSACWEMPHKDKQLDKGADSEVHPGLTICSSFPCLKWLPFALRREMSVFDVPTKPAIWACPLLHWAVATLALSQFQKHASTELHVIPSLKLARAAFSSCMFIVYPVLTPSHAKNNTTESKAK